VYARISSDGEGRSLGVQRQLEDCRKLAGERGWVIGREYVDNDVSAYSGRQRIEYARMCDDVAAGVRDDPLTDTIGKLRRDIAHASDCGPLSELAGHGGELRARWDQISLDRRHAIIRAALDHAVIGPGTPGRRTFDINRVQPVWRI
jgi:hypothetical protein